MEPKKRVWGELGEGLLEETMFELSLKRWKALSIWREEEGDGRLYRQ